MSEIAGDFDAMGVAPGRLRVDPTDDWEALWGPPSDPSPLDLRRIQRQLERLANEVPLIDERDTFGALVGSEELRAEPIHRWFTFKEGYSPRLLTSVIDRLGLGSDLAVVDAFSGVATTALSGLIEPRVSEVRSVEYSPWARFVGSTKLTWPELDAVALRAALPRALDYSTKPRASVPDLAAFSNPEIFDRRTLRSLISAREHLKTLTAVTEVERDFFLVGLGAVIEDLSGAMKDGRALRIVRNRKRRASSLKDSRPALVVRGRIKQALAGQWTAMIEDVEAMAPKRRDARATVASVVAGDARALSACIDRRPGSSVEWADLACFSPPYMNCIDYTELYKIELWLMEHIASQSEFRRMRLGTLRSHPSVKFDERDSFADIRERPVVRLIADVSKWLTDNSARRDVGPVVQSYFEDMFEVWREHHKVLKAGGVATCVVANSTFARRDRTEHGEHLERWRLPLLTDVLLAHLALEAGFARTEIWTARSLRPRNVRNGVARESVVVAFKQ